MTYARKKIAALREWTDRKILMPLFRSTILNLSEKYDQKLVEHDVMCNWKQQSLEEYRIWLSELPEEVTPAEEALSSDLNTCDLFTVLSEMAALRQEIRLQNREQSKSAKALSASHELCSLSVDFFKSRDQSLKELERSVRTNTETAVARRFFDIRDSLSRGLAAAKKAAEPHKGFFGKKTSALKSLPEGYEMALRKFDQVLEESGIRPVETLGKKFDPKTMKAVGKEQKEGTEQGLVIREVSCGFVMADGLLRTAEVIVSK